MVTIGARQVDLNERSKLWTINGELVAEPNSRGVYQPVRKQNEQDEQD